MYPPGHNCCCTCYYLSPYVCCDGGVGPVRYRVRSNSSLLATFAASGDPLFAIIKPQGFELDLDYIAFAITDIEWASGDLDYQPECWLVEASDTCDEGELIDWVEFDAVQSDETASIGFYEKGNVEEATVFYDPDLYPAPEECEPNNPDHCPVKVCGVCVSASSVMTATIAATVYNEYLDDDVELSRSVEGTPGCAATSSLGEDDQPPDPTPYPSTETTAQWSWQVNCDGTGELGVVFTSWEEPMGVFRGQASGTFDAAGNVTPVLESGVTLPETVTATWSIASPVAWTTDGEGNCVVEEAP